MSPLDVCQRMSCREVVERKPQFGVSNLICFRRWERMHLEVIAPLSWLSLPCDESQRKKKKRRSHYCGRMFELAQTINRGPPVCIRRQKDHTSTLTMLYCSLCQRSVTFGNTKIAQYVLKGRRGVGVGEEKQTTRAHTHTRARARTQTHATPHTHTPTHARTNARTHTCTHTRTHARTHAQTHTHTRARTQTHPAPVRTQKHAPTHARTHTNAHARTHA